MVFRISDSFTDSLARLTNDEQKAVKTTAFDLQIDPTGSGKQFHKLERARDKNFWSVRVNLDIRIIVHRTAESLLLCYVNHHDKAYDWAAKRKIQIHPKTGAAQLIEIRETIKQIVIPKYSEVERKTAVLKNYRAAELLKWGIPEEWIEDIRQADEDLLLEIAEHLPSEAAEAVLNLAAGTIPVSQIDCREINDPFNHPDALRRFRTMDNTEELALALDYPWEKWTVFLHPVQKVLVEGEYNGPVRISGSAGTGKTIVALHRAVYLAKKHHEFRILLATFSDTLAQSLFSKLRILIHSQPRLADQIEVRCLDNYAIQLFRKNIGVVSLVDEQNINDIAAVCRAKVSDCRFSLPFIISEWTEMIDAQQINSADDYCGIKRTGRKRRLSETQRRELWSIFSAINKRLTDQGVKTIPKIYNELTDLYSERKNAPFDYVIVDEAQDLSVAQLKFLSAMGHSKPEMLIFTGDPGQRIFQLPFSWKALGVDISGRAKTLKINYRTSHQIRCRADLLLDSEIIDVDGNTVTRKDTVSVFNGERPSIKICADTIEETNVVSTWLNAIISSGTELHEIGLIVRSEQQLPRALKIVENTGVDYRVLTVDFDIVPDQISILTMPLAKGLEFKAVAVMACDDEAVPLQSRIDESADDADLEEVYNTERHLLYVACTRARDSLLVTGVKPGSEFLDDMGI